jgi:hypothetical protein
MAENVMLTSGHTMNMVPAGTITTTGTTDWVPKGSPDTAVQVTVTGTGAVSATVNIEVSNDGVSALTTPAGTITLSGTDSSSDGFVTQNASWKYIRMNVTALSGTDAVVTGVLGI